jgi:coenzyme F420-reducing hydrogenase delta subunit
MMGFIVEGLIETRMEFVSLRRKLDKVYIDPERIEMMIRKTDEWNRIVFIPLNERQSLVQRIIDRSLILIDHYIQSLILINET